jgi:hypothetical protein
VLYDCKTRFPTLREELSIRVFENGITRRIFWPKKNGNVERRRLHKEVPHILYCSLNIVKYRRIRWEGHPAIMEGLQVSTE